MPRIIFVGAGNLAWHLAPALEAAGLVVSGIFSRRTAAAKQLAARLYSTKVLNSLDFSRLRADVVLLSVSDGAIAQVASALTLPPDAIVAHLSGATPLRSISENTQNPCGVLYPLQTFGKNDRKINFAEVPFCIHASDQNTRRTLRKMAGQLSRNVYELDDQQRLKLHLAAVISANFTNHLLLRAHDMLTEHHINTDLLKPLVEETVRKFFAQKNADTQSGPARRNDENTLSAHEKLLDNYPQIKTLYQCLSQSIGQYHGGF